MTITTPNGHNFVLYQNEAVTIDLFSSLFVTDGELKGSYSYAGKAPLLPNKKAINHGDMLEKHTSGVLENLQVRLGHIYWTNVNMSWQVNNGKEIEFALTLNLSLINERIKNTRLPELAFPVYYLGDSEVQVRNSMMEASRNNDWHDIPYTFAPVRNTYFSDDASNAYVNSMRVHNGEFIFNAPNYLQNGTPIYQAIPFFYLNYVLVRIAEWLGFQFAGEVFTDPDISKMVIYNINTARISTKDPLIGLPENSEGMYITASDHLPDLPVSEFLKQLGDIGIYPVLRPNRNELLFRLKNRIREFDVKDWSDKILNVETIDPDQFGGLHLKFETLMSRMGAAFVDDSVKIGRAEQSRELKVSSLTSVSLLSHITGEIFGEWHASTWQLPFDDKPGNIMDPNFVNNPNYAPTNDKKEFPLTLLFWNGWVQDAGNMLEYPQLSIQNRETGRELYLASENGIYHTFLKDYLLATEGAKEIKVDLLLTHKDTAQWCDDDIIILRSESGVSVPCLLRQLSFDVYPDSDVIRAKGEGIVLDSTVMKPLANDRLFLKSELINVTDEWVYTEAGVGGAINSRYEKKGDYVFSLFYDRECLNPYTGTDIVPVDIIQKSKTWTYPSDPNAFDDLSTGLRLLLRNGTRTLQGAVLEASTAFAQLTAYSYLSTIDVQENSRFYLV